MKRPTQRSMWFLAAASIATVGVLTFTVLQFRKELKGIIQSAISQWQPLEESVETELQSHLISIQGQRRLIVASLDRQEAFTRTSKITLFEKLDLPEVIVRIEAPVHYQYTLDLKDPWQLVRRGNALVVYPPELDSTLPAVDLSKMEFKVDKPSLFRNEDKVLKGLQTALMPLLLKQAITYRNEVREIARKETAGFIRQFILQTKPDLANMNVHVVFPNESLSEVLKT